MKPKSYTIVQHSGYGYAYKPDFVRGLESRTISSKAELARVQRAGGLVFETHAAAEAYAMATMYPPDYAGLVPCADGTFSAAKIDGLAIYIAGKQP